MAAPHADVESYLAALEHPRRDAIEALRRAILDQDTGRITETVKWNAPNFRYDGEDRATMRLQPGDRLEVVLHRGAKVRSDSDEFAFHDESGLLRWLSADRAVIEFPAPTSPATSGSPLIPEAAELVHAWMRASA